MKRAVHIAEDKVYGSYAINLPPREEHNESASLNRPHGQSKVKMVSSQVADERELQLHADRDLLDHDPGLDDFIDDSGLQ